VNSILKMVWQLISTVYDLFIVDLYGKFQQGRFRQMKVLQFVKKLLEMVIKKDNLSEDQMMICFMRFEPINII
jgi:hypothetical protein